MATIYSPRTIPTTSYSVRTWVQTDLGYLITQLGILCDNSGNRIVFHTGNYSPWETPYSTRTIPETTYTVRPTI